MNTIKKCPHCQLEVEPKATKCPHCKSDLRPWIRRHPLLSLFLVIIIIPMFISLSSPDTSTPTSPAQELINLKKEDASHVARAIVRDVPLKSPSTAKYTPPTITQDPKDPNQFEAESYLDSENGFGAMVRTYWSMKLRYTGAETKEAIDEGANWKIVEFVFDGEKVKI